MPIVITINQQITRECCKAQDLLLYMGGSQNFPPRSDPMFCRYCGQLSILARKIDAAGSLDWERYNIIPDYEKISFGKENKCLK